MFNSINGVVDGFGNLLKSGLKTVGSFTAVAVGQRILSEAKQKLDKQLEKAEQNLDKKKKAEERKKKAAVMGNNAGALTKLVQPEITPEEVDDVDTTDYPER